MTTTTHNEAEGNGNLQAGKAINSHKAHHIGQNYQAGGSITRISDNETSGEGAIIGQDNQSIQGNEFGDSNTIVQARNIDYSLTGHRNTGNAIGNHNHVTVHNHYHHESFDSLLKAYLELMGKYTRLLELQAATA